MLVDLLAALGHRRMAYISAPVFLRPTETRRLEFLEATARHGAESLVVTPPEDGFTGGRAAARELRRTGFAPTAILCVNDWIAVGVIRELRNQGLWCTTSLRLNGLYEAGVNTVRANSRGRHRRECQAQQLPQSGPH